MLGAAGLGLVAGCGRWPGQAQATKVGRIGFLAPGDPQPQRPQPARDEVSGLAADLDRPLLSGAACVCRRRTHQPRHVALPRTVAHLTLRHLTRLVSRRRRQ